MASLKYNPASLGAVSYTHLDVYKRQQLGELDNDMSFEEIEELEEL